MEQNELKVLTPKDVQQILHIGKSKTMETFHRSDFPAYRIGNRMFITEENLKKWIEKQQK